MARRYLNSLYANPYPVRDFVGENIPGTELWINASIKRGTLRDPPTVRWTARRPAAAGDPDFDEDRFIADPILEARRGWEREDTRWARVTLPDVTGLSWTFFATRSKDGKPDKTVQAEGTVETWRRHFINVTADDEALYRLYLQALPLFQAALAEACIEVVENLVTVGGTPRAGKTVDKSRAGGRSLGAVWTAHLHQPARSSVGLTLRVDIIAGEPNCGPITRMENNDLVVTLAGGEWDERAISNLRVHENDVELASFAHHGRMDGAAGEPQAARAVLAAVCERIDHREVRVHLDHPHLNSRRDAETGAWTVPRPRTALAALQAGRVSLELGSNYSGVGGLSGMVNGAQSGFDVYISANPAKLAAVMAHEFAHLCGLVRPASTQRYDDARLDHSDRSATRPQAAVPVANGRYYDATFGGSGTHCGAGTTLAPSCVTDARQTRAHATGEAMCVMFHAGMLHRDGTAIQADDVHFCASCIRQLRGL